MDNFDLLSLKETADYLKERGVHLTTTTLRHYCLGRLQPRLPAKKFGRDWATTPEQIDQWLILRSEKGTPDAH